MPITIKKIDLYGKDVEPKNSVSNEYPTSHNALRAPPLMYVSAVRNSGKSFSVSKLVRQAQKEKTYNRIYLISPTFLSNVAYFGDLLDREDVFEPTKDSIQKVIELVEEDRDEFEEFLAKKKEYDEFIKKLKSGKEFTDEEIMRYMGLDFFEETLEAPKYKYGKVEPPKSLLILDDVLATPAILQSSGLQSLACKNRHIAQLKEEFIYPDGMRRSACGLGVIIISQSYKMPQGIGRAIRENVSALMIFKNKQEKELQKIKEELGSAVDENKFTEAYEIATKEKFGNLLVDFNPKCPTQTFRKNLNQLIIFDDDMKQCNCPKKN